MVRVRQTGSAEQELIEAERAVLGGSKQDVVLSLVARVMRRSGDSAAGHEKHEETREKIFIHLAACSGCVQFMAEIREQEIARSGVGCVTSEVDVGHGRSGYRCRGRIGWNGRHREIQSPEQRAIVDLRLISPTRGDHPVAGPGAKVPR